MLRAYEAKMKTDSTNEKNYLNTVEKDPKFNSLVSEIEQKISEAIEDGFYSVSVKVEESYFEVFENYYKILGYQISDSSMRGLTKISWR